jgi:hypothetical protein
MSLSKKQLGKFYTVSNPFDLAVFRDWFNHVPNVSELTIIEPFAGSNNIVKLMGVGNNWNCFDILPTTNLVPEFQIIKRDTIANFPKGYSIGITNPPYLAKNSATRNGIIYQGDPYDDLYKKCLEVMLSNLDYVAAIIPESFITAGIFQKRLTCVISLTCKMFDDTDCPVCLAIFDKEESDDFYVYQLDNFIGKYNKNLIWYRVIDHGIYKWKFNDPQGEIGIWAIDNTTSNTIKFLLGNKIDASNVKSTSRSNTRVSPIGFKVKNLDLFCEKCNDCLEWYRSCTNDIFMTSFKGLRSDGKYRRRLDWGTARGIMEMVLDRFKIELL